MATPIYLPTTTTSLLVNTRTLPKIVYLPAASTIGSGKLFFIKDICGNAANSSIYLSTTGRDLFDGRAGSSIVYGLMSTNFQSLLLAPDGSLNWMILQNYNANVITRGVGFSPLNISGIQLWLDGSDSSTLSLSGTTVTQWRDKSGLGNNTSATGGTNTYTTNAINGLSAVSLNNSWLTGGFTTTFTGTQVQAFAVATLSSGAGTWGRVLSLGRPGVNDYNATDTTFMIIRYSGGQSVGIGRNSSYLSVGIPAYSTPFIVQSSHNGATEAIGVNGTLTPSTQNTGVGSGFNITSYGIGTNTNTGDATYWAGYVGEVIYYTGLLTTLQIQQVEGYLAWKWGLQSLLPSGHPYKNSPP
jgi:hypothetical protein